MNRTRNFVGGQFTNNQHDNPLPMVAGVDERNNVERFIEAEGNRDETSGFPPGVPDPNPETPPVAVVPEPPTAAILSISAIVLLYLLFGRQKKQRLYRRS